MQKLWRFHESFREVVEASMEAFGDFNEQEPIGYQTLCATIGVAVLYVRPPHF